MRWRSGSSARMYAEGDGVTQDDLKAFEYFRRIADTPCRGQSGHAAGALRRQRVRGARPLLSRRHPEDGDQARSRPRARDVRLCGLVFPRSRSAVLSGAALSRRHRRAARPAPGGALVRPLGAEGPVPGAGHAGRHAVCRRPRAAPGGARADVADARQGQRQGRRRQRSGLDRPSSTTAPSSRRPKTSARWRWSISSAGWRRGASRSPSGR